MEGGKKGNAILFLLGPFFTELSTSWKLSNLIKVYSVGAKVAHQFAGSAP